MTIDTHKRICPACGNRLTIETTVCDVCGEDLSEVSTASNTAHAEEAQHMPEQEEKKCPKCGSGNAMTNTFCGSCGAKLSAQSSPRAAEQKQGPAPQRSVHKKNPSKNKAPNKASSPTIHVSFKFWQLLVAAGIIIGGIIIAILLMKPTHPSATGDVPQPPIGGTGTINLQHLDELKSRMESNPLDKKAILIYANALQDAKLLDQAITQYTRYIKDVPDDVNAHVDLGVCYFDLKRYDDAIKSMETGVRIDPTHVLGNFNLGIVNKNAGNTDKAVEWFRKVIALSPQSRTAEQAKSILSELGQTQ